MGQYTVSASDLASGDAFDVPGDEPGTDESYPVDDVNKRSGKRWYVHVENGFNENADVTVQGSHYRDSAIDAPVDDGTAETVNAGANAAIDGETGHSFIQVNVDPAANPTSGDLVVTFQSRVE